MAKERKPLGITCASTDCKNGLHCFKATKAVVAKQQPGTCRQCGASLVDWQRVHQCNLTDVAYTFDSLKHEYIRHFFWHKPLSEKAINHARRKGKCGIRERVRHHLEKVIGPATPFHDGYQTTMMDGAPTVVPYAQHATATCCRKCLMYWHGISEGRPMTSEELNYCTHLVCLYIEDRIPQLTEDGETIPPIRRPK